MKSSHRVHALAEILDFVIVLKAEEYGFSSLLIEENGAINHFVLSPAMDA
jgi:hypothetical protein